MIPRKPRILFIMHMPPPVHGAAMMGKYIHDSRIVNDTFECHYMNATTAKKLEDVGKLSVRKIADIVGLARNVKNNIQRIKPDLVYFTANSAGVPFYKDYIIMQVIKRSGTPVIVHFHNKGVATHQHRWLDNFLYHHFFKDIKVILLAETLYTDVQKYVRKENVFFCPNGIPDENKYERQTELTILPDSPLHLLFLSNMMADKGVWTLLNACQELKKKGITFSCDFVGGWKDVTESAFNNYIKAHDLTNYVKTHGPKYEGEKISYIQKADVLILPTANECFPLVLLEAMQQSKACIAHKEGGIPNVIDDGITGFVVDKGNLKSLVNAIERLYNDRLLCYNMGKEGRKRFEEHFTISIFERNLTNILYQNCIKK